MVPESLHDFFLASASVAGALIGLLFVAISVVRDRLAERDEMQTNRIRAHAALTAFVNALVISLFGLIPDLRLGWVAGVEGLIGLLFVAGSLLSLRRLHRLRPHHAGDLRDAAFLFGLLASFVGQLVAGVASLTAPARSGWMHLIAVIVIVDFSIGIARAWELIGGPSIGFGREVGAILHASSDERSSTSDPLQRSGLGPGSIT